MLYGTTLGKRKFSVCLPSFKMSVTIHCLDNFTLAVSLGSKHVTSCQACQSVVEAAYWLVTEAKALKGWAHFTLLGIRVCETEFLMKGPGEKNKIIIPIKNNNGGKF